ncbi:MAG: hypothetical protein JWN89_632 [Parcubacteria group bacterium]|nr:hypothetical protein [Parcubacteria group bacterium]
MAFSDKAVETVEEDLLGRKGFAKRIAKDILSWKDSDSLVIGLYAKWGDGKTSVVNFIKDFYNHPDKFEEDIDQDKIPTIIEFNPWIFSNQGDLVQNFLLEVGKELGQKNNEIDKEIARQLGLVKLYLGTITKIKDKAFLPIIRLWLPILGLTGVVILDKIFAFSPIAYVGTIILILILESLTFIEGLVSMAEDFYKKKSSLTEKTLNQLKNDIRETLSKRDRKILFIIDDIDRLTPEEVRNLFQLVKINLDLPNLIYLMVMDVGTVGKMISKDGIEGMEYIEKIVQIPISLPKADDKKLSEFLFAQLDELIKFFSESKWDKNRWATLYHSGLGKAFLKRGNLRIIKRPLSQMTMAASLISSEVDPVDFLGIRTLEHFYPDLYNYISNNKEEFTTLNHHRDYQSKRLDEIRKNIGIELVKVDPFIKDFLVELFPPLKSVLENYSMGDTIEQEWRQNRRICSADHFDTYFFLNVPEGEMRSSEITSALEKVRDYKQFSALLHGYLKTQDKKKDIRKFLTTILDHVKEFPTEGNKIAQTLTVLLDIADEVSGIKSHQMFDFGAETDLMRVIHFYLKSLKDREISIFEPSREAIRKTKSLYGAIHLISSYFPRPEKESSGREKLFDNLEITELSKEGLKKINKAYKDGSLKKQENLVYILYRWKEWGGEKDMRTFVNTYKKSRLALAEFVSKFKTISLRSSGMITEQIPRISFSSLKEFFDLDYIKTTIDKVKLDKLPDNQKDAISLFKKDFPKRNDPMY